MLTAGVPCQPASRAGKQRGTEDDRWLWPEALRVLAEVEPRWALFENPAGIYDVGIDGILSDLAGCGYEVGLCEIPACAVNAPHRRNRVWIICRRLADARREQRHEGRERGACDEEDTRGRQRDNVHDQRCGAGQWDNFTWVPCADGKFRRAPDESFRVVDGLHRSVLAALGNSIVPQVAAEIIGAMLAADEDSCLNGGIF